MDCHYRLGGQGKTITHSQCVSCMRRQRAQGPQLGARTNFAEGGRGTAGGLGGGPKEEEQDGEAEGDDEGYIGFLRVTKTRS